jgi:hypothetical protein
MTAKDYESFGIRRRLRQRFELTTKIGRSSNAPPKLDTPIAPAVDTSAGLADTDGCASARLPSASTTQQV